MQQVLIHQNLLKRLIEQALKSIIDKLHIDKLEDAPSNLNNLKSKVYKLGIDKLVTVPVDLSKLSDVVKSDAVEKDVYDAQIYDAKILKIKYLILLT